MPWFSYDFQRTAASTFHKQLPVAGAPRGRDDG
jgi:hypothetical protein